MFFFQNYYTEFEHVVQYLFTPLYGLYRAENKEIALKIKLREMTLEDLPIYEMYYMEKYKWHKYDGPYYPDNEEEDKEYIAGIRNKLENGQAAFNGRKVIADVETNKLIGTVNYYWVLKETNWLEVGIAIFDDKIWSKGIGYQALKLWINEILADKSELVRIGISTWSGNVGMIKLAEKLGLKKEAEYKNAVIVNGKYYDSVSYGILREEWYKLKK